MEEWICTVKGRVQGVGFRASVIGFIREHELSLKGYIRNLPDKTLEVRAQGRMMELEFLVHFLRKGPPMARVDEVSISKTTTLSKFNNFSVI